MLLAFDELNRLASEQPVRSMDIDRYFDEMELPAGEKQDRKEFARRLEDRLFLILAFLHVLMERGGGLQPAKDRLENELADLMKEYTYPDSSMLDYIRRYADEFVETTARRGGDGEKAAYWFSQDRARYNAENEANTLFNYEQFRQAREDGYTHKQWKTLKDERVRLTHAEVDDEVISIDEYFQVGEYAMLFPKDPNAGPEETVNCRCSLKFLNLLDDTGDIDNEPSIQTDQGVLYKGFEDIWRDLYEYEETIDVNPSERNDNCVNCTIAYEMRWRGKAVRAGKPDQALLREPFSGWVDPEIITTYPPSDAQDYISTVMNLWGNGARAQIAVIHRGMGHSFTAIQRNGATYFIDSQRGMSYNFDVLNQYFEGCSDVRFCRIDNLQINELGFEACEGVK